MVLTWSDLLLDLNLGQLDLEHLGDHPDSHLEQVAVGGGLLLLLLISITEPAGLLSSSFSSSSSKSSSADFVSSTFIVGLVIVESKSNSSSASPSRTEFPDVVLFYCFLIHVFLKFIFF